MSKRATRNSKKPAPNPVSVSTARTKPKQTKVRGKAPAPAPAKVEEEDLSKLSEGSDAERSDSSADLSSVASPLVKKKAAAGTPGSGASSRRYNPLRTNSAGLPDAVQIALLEQIESKGGRDQFFLRHKALHCVCEESDESRALFGTADSERRKSVRWKVRHWRDLPKEVYSTAVRQLGVFTWEDRSEEERQAFLHTLQSSAKPTKHTFQSPASSSKKKPPRSTSKRAGHFESDLSFAKPKVVHSSSSSEDKVPPQDIGFSCSKMSSQEIGKTVLMELAPESVARAAGVDFVSKCHVVCLSLSCVRNQFLNHLHTLLDSPPPSEHQEPVAQSVSVQSLFMSQHGRDWDTKKAQGVLWWVGGHDEGSPLRRSGRTRSQDASFCLQVSPSYKHHTRCGSALVGFR